MSKIYFKNKEEAIKELNSKLFILGDGTIMKRNKNKAGHESYTSVKVEEIKMFYANKPVMVFSSNGKYSYVNPVNLWLASPARIEYQNGMGIYPQGEEPEGTLNLFQGWQVDAIKGDWSFLQDHILDNICNGDKKLNAYIMEWLAFAIQKPTNVPETALVLLGGQGMGKTSFVDHVGKLFGKHYLKDSNSATFVGRFREQLEGAILCFWDEASFVSHRKSFNRFKDMITSDTLTIEPKGRKSNQMQNCTHLILASNNMHAIQATADERRFVMFWLENKKPTSYFKAIAEQMNTGGYEALMYDLLNYKLGNIDLRDIPITEALILQKIESFDPLTTWWLDRLHNKNVWNCNVDTEDLYQDMERFFQRTHTRRERPSLASFGKQLSNLTKQSIVRGKNSKPHSMSGKRASYYILPDVVSLRKAFEQAKGIKGYNWNNEYIVEEYSDVA